MVRHPPGGQPRGDIDIRVNVEREAVQEHHDRPVGRTFLVVGDVENAGIGVMKWFQPARRGGTRGCRGLSGLGKNRSRFELHGCNSRYGCFENEATLAIDGFGHQFSEINHLTCETLDSETKIAKAVYGDYTAKFR